MPEADTTFRESTTRLLCEWSNGNRGALDQLTGRVYRELHTLAASYLRRRRADAVLQPTVLINELYVRLIDHSQPLPYASRSHFFGIAARVMRQILADHARARRSAKRGGGAAAVTLKDLPALGCDRVPDMLDVDNALTLLAGVDDRKANVIELRYFGGLSREEIAADMGLTVATVKRDLRIGEAWLRRHFTMPEGDRGEATV
jgi:RNA polymerase sigma-70 factor (ECF subfamily)